ncbi:hypothetical protein HMPREF9080_00344 [Cardiobacterium valvarum F0432]|uniref:Uncharacterized protein n=1 Tax=Cardiobacterium valvarum F0432 TaxID=797473 RepID=G9ZC62_9GAMM|nr:hypothetical protein HMPREF9080_00344 [Cardiobacterium valvarum F0432]
MRVTRRVAAQYDVGTAQAGGCFAQGAGGQEEAVAQAKVGGDDDDFCVAGEGVVLQAVIGDEQVGRRVVVQEFLRGGGALSGDNYRRTGSLPEQQRFVANYSGIRAGGDIGSGLCTAAVATADDADVNVACLQPSCECLHQRGFAAAADGEVADDEDGHGRPPALQDATAVEHAAGGTDRGKEGSKRQEEEADGVTAVPEAGNVAHGGNPVLLGWDTQKGGNPPFMLFNQAIRLLPHARDSY